ncbi:MAG: protein translocase subunit SecF [Patescibacteria group bacterium]
MNIIGNKKIFISISLLLTIASIVAIAIFGFKFAIDFSGGTLWQLSFEEPVTREELQSFTIETLKIESPIITEETSGDSFFIRMPEISEEEHREHRESLVEEFGAVTELRYETIGSAIGKELRSRSLTAFILVLVAISLYIAFAFRKVLHPVSSWKYGIITLVSLFHDALVPAGLYAVLGYYYGAEVDTNFVVAILVVIGFSVHDTIVVFDRIRENLRSAGSAARDEFDGIVNTSVNQTFARSINTSLTLFLVVVALFFWGAPSLRYFMLVIGVGTVIGTYSSIFLASPLLTLWKKK